MNICIKCKHLVRSPVEGSSNVGCAKVRVEPVCDPVTGEIVASGPALRVEERFDAKTISLRFYARCRDANKGNCTMYEQEVVHG